MTVTNGLQCLDRRDFDLATVGQPIAALDEFDKSSAQRSLNCIHCNQPITDPESGIVIGSQTIHSFTNPHGITFRIGCFREAPGVASQGDPCDFWSWFPGYQWQIELCRRCGLHLGWRFSNNDDCFYGLILKRLIERTGDKPLLM